MSKTILHIMHPETVPELTRISSKGQVVIPAKVRSKLGLKAGNIFAILTSPKSNVVVLKKVDDKKLQADLMLFREVEKAWEEIREGKMRKASRRRFLEELQTC
ncbi:MAG: AbrB/MazE/SpoVT family DNA-binding domain-containing protein [Candidatus Bathyarchaeia archaeon]